MKQCFIWPARTHWHVSVYKQGHIKYDMIISVHLENNREIKAFIVLKNDCGVFGCVCNYFVRINLRISLFLILLRIKGCQLIKSYIQMITNFINIYRLLLQINSCRSTPVRLFLIPVRYFNEIFIE